MIKALSSPILNLLTHHFPLHNLNADYPNFDSLTCSFSWRSNFVSERYASVFPNLLQLKRQITILGQMDGKRGEGRGEGRFLYSGTALGLNCPSCQEPQWNLNTWRHCWLSSTKGKLYSVYTLSNIPNKWRQGNYVFFKNCLRVTFCCK